MQSMLIFMIPKHFRISINFYSQVFLDMGYSSYVSVVSEFWIS